MKLQTSHATAKRPHRYSGVYQQQGRMITDADWNQLTDIEKTRLENALRDAVASGAPREDGLRLVQSGDEVRLVPGVLYAEGVPARLPGEASEPLALTEQPDFPGAPALDGGPAVLYADVWERCVTALEDTGLMDPALHGADTTARTETLLQVKWCPPDADPMDPAQNPPRGDAPLSLQLRRILVGNDPCDPCASEADLDERVGNYLFRVEVHDRFVEDGARHLILKWSRDNGAEAHRVDDLPPGFTRGDWVWEFFDPSSEKLLGHHFQDHPTSRREALTTDFDDVSEEAPDTFVRQWDGYAHIDLDNQTLIEGLDRGTPLDEGAPVEAHGHTDLTGGVLRINGEQLVLRLAYEDGAFLPGDYWQAAVRESVSEPGDFVLGTDSTGEPPLGVHHHYVRLGALSADGRLVEPSDPEYRQFHFPPLTDLTARDIGYRLPECERPSSILNLLKAQLDEHWPDDDGDKQVNVRAMLDTLLCHLSSDALPHSVSACDAQEGRTLRAALGLTPGAQPTGEVLNKVLCETNASHLPLDKTDEGLCAELQPGEVDSVQEALKVLCRRDTGGCARVVKPGELEAVLKELIRSEARDIWLCLKPGEHVLSEDLNLLAGGLIRITGAGAGSSRIVLRSAQASLSAPEIYLKDVGLAMGDNTVGQWQLAGQVIHLDGVQANASERQPRQPLVHVMGTDPDGLGLNELDVRRCRFLLRGAGAALKIEQIRTRATLRDNYIYGEVHYSHAIQKAVNPDDQKISGSSVDGEPVGGIDSTFYVDNNFLFRWVSLMESGSTDVENQLVKALSGPNTFTFSNNVMAFGSSVTGKRLIAQGNQLFDSGSSEQTNGPLWLFSNQLVASGHIGESPNTNALYLVHQRQGAVSNNLIGFVAL